MIYSSGQSLAWNKMAAHPNAPNPNIVTTLAKIGKINHYESPGLGGFRYRLNPNS